MTLTPTEPNELRDRDEVESQFDEAIGLVAEGKNPYPGMKYVEGVRDALAWVLGESDDVPLDLDEIKWRD